MAVRPIRPAGGASRGGNHPEPGGWRRGGRRGCQVGGSPAAPDRSPPPAAYSRLPATPHAEPQVQGGSRADPPTEPPRARRTPWQAREQLLAGAGGVRRRCEWTSQAPRRSGGAPPSLAALHQTTAPTGTEDSYRAADRYQPDDGRTRWPHRLTGAIQRTSFWPSARVLPAPGRPFGTLPTATRRA